MKRWMGESLVNRRWVFVSGQPGHYSDHQILGTISCFLLSLNTIIGLWSKMSISIIKKNAPSFGTFFKIHCSLQFFSFKQTGKQNCIYITSVRTVSLTGRVSVPWRGGEVRATVVRSFKSQDRLYQLLLSFVSRNSSWSSSYYHFCILYINVLTIMNLGSTLF